jgi:dolichol-phosphate mannosyltransferase
MWIGPNNDPVVTDGTEKGIVMVMTRELRAVSAFEALRSAPELTVVVPTLNERDNVSDLIERIAAALQGVDWELMFVDDDSEDGTAQAVKAVGRTDARVRCIKRIGRRGLSGACLEGILASQAPYVAVIDGDLQHDESLLSSMLDVLRGGRADLVVGSRYSAGGSRDGLAGWRRASSRWATSFTRSLLGAQLSDPMSGFFMIRREPVEQMAHQLSTQGFKILLDIVMTARGRLLLVELPYRFRPRFRGSSKLDTRVLLEFVGLVLAKATNDLLGARFVLFALMGLIGLGAHFLVLSAAFGALGIAFGSSQTAATLAAIPVNFTLNNFITYRSQRLRGRRFLEGLLRFYAVSLMGAISNIGVGNWFFATNSVWWVAGLAGAIMGVTWNYAVASVFVWRTR